MVQRRPSHAQENPVTAIDIALEPDATMVRQAEADNARLLKAYPEGFALDATHHAHITMLQQFVRPAELEKVYSAANAVLAKEGVASRRLKAIKYYYIPSPPLGIAGIVVEFDGRFAPAAIRTAGRCCAFHREDGDTCRVRQHRSWARHQTRTYRLRSQFHHGCSRQKIQSARHNWCRSRDLSQRDARGTVRGVHAFTGERGCLSTRQLWRRPQGAPSIVADALSALPAYAVPKRAPVNGERQLFGFLDDRGQRCRCADSPAGHAGHPDDLWLPVPMIVMDIAKLQAFFEPIETKTAEPRNGSWPM